MDKFSPYIWCGILNARGDNTTKYNMDYVKEVFNTTKIDFYTGRVTEREFLELLLLNSEEIDVIETLRNGY